MARRRPNLQGDAENFEVIRQELGFGFISELTSMDMALVAPFAGKMDTFVYCAGSGLAVGSYSEFYGPDERPLAIELIRYEPNPQPNEGPLNINRFVFGPSKDGSRYEGYDVTIYEPNPTNGQVGNHWTTWEEVDARFATKPKPPGGNP